MIHGFPDFWYSWRAQMAGLSDRFQVVAIDQRGTRLGRGKGHYDAALARLRKGGARLVGIGWSEQLIAEEIPANEWVVALDGFVSPDEVRWFRAESR